MSEQIDNLLHEVRRFPPSAEFVANAVAPPEIYAEAKDDRLAGRVLTDMAKGLSKGPPPEVHGIVVGVSKDGTTVGEQPLPIDAKFCGGNYTGKGGSFFT